MDNKASTKPKQVTQLYLSLALLSPILFHAFAIVSNDPLTDLLSSLSFPRLTCVHLDVAYKGLVKWMTMFHGMGALQATGQITFRATAGRFIKRNSPLYFSADHNNVTLLALLCFYCFKIILIF